MPTLFWSLSTDPKKQAASQANLILAHFNITGEQLIEPEEPKREPIDIPVDTDMTTEEIARFMQEKPKPGRIQPL